MCPYTSIIATDGNVKDFSHEIKKKQNGERRRQFCHSICNDYFLLLCFCAKTF